MEQDFLLHNSQPRLEDAANTFVCPWSMTAHLLKHQFLIKELKTKIKELEIR